MVQGNDMAVGAVKSRKAYPVDAVQLYATTNKHIGAVSSENPFKGTVQWGLFSWNYGEGGQVDPTEYADDGSEYHQKTLCWA